VPVAAVPAPQRSATEPSWSLSDFEQLLSGRGLAWLGGLAILIGAVFFIGLAFTRGWIGPAGRVGIELVAGLGLVAGGAWFFERREARFGHVLVAVGLGMISLALVAATRLYGLIPVEVGLVAALATAIGAAVIAIRADSQVVAGYGLVTALVAPPLLGASPTFATIAFLAAALLGTTAIALNRSWGWLSSLAFLLTAPQLWTWLTGDAGLATGLAALGGFWLLNALAAGGEEFRTRRHQLRPTSATLLTVNAIFAVAAGFTLLNLHSAAGGGVFGYPPATLVGFMLLNLHGAAGARGLFLLIVAGAHFLLAAYFLAAEGERHPFGLLAAGVGLTALTSAVPLLLGGSAIPICWAAEGVALTWVYGWRRHGYSGIAGAIVGTLAIAHLLLYEYPILALPISTPNHARPFLNASATTLGFILLAFAAAGYFARSARVREALAALGTLLVIYALAFEVSGVALLTGWAAVSVLAIALNRGLTFLRDRMPTNSDVTDRVHGLLYAPALFAAALAVVHLTTVELPVLGLVLLPARPFTDSGTLAAVILIAASLLAGWLDVHPLARRLAIVAAFVVAQYLTPFEVPAAPTVVIWSLLALALCCLGRWDPVGKRPYLGAAAMIAGQGFWIVLTDVAAPDRLAVHARSAVNHPLFWSGATAALGALVVALVGAAWLYRADRRARWLAMLAGALIVYLLSVGVVDSFQSAVRPGADLASLQKQAQVALSILWAVLGGAAFVAGVARWIGPLRAGGLALLALATTKVFLFDLASLDATYKVPSFIGLGLLLLVSSYAYQRLKPQAAH
ncbi:MAG TPA: DUF2339 domain-containing protein, partial [Thermomicrobiales bacterium]|nr:DUF2339 domain-containing protein [Thermomicrobiales bacterium]